MKRKLIPALILLVAVSVIGFLVTGLSEKASANPGDEAIEFELKDMNGKVHKLSDYRGKKVVINFFATWCAPCIEEAPELEAFNSEYDGAELIVVAKGEPIKRMEKYVAEQNSKLLYLLDTKEEVAKQYNVIGQPDTMIIDENGIIRERFTGPTTKAKLIELIEGLD